MLNVKPCKLSELYSAISSKVNLISRNKTLCVLVRSPNIILILNSTSVLKTRTRLVLNYICRQQLPMTFFFIRMVFKSLLLYYRQLYPRKCSWTPNTKPLDFWEFYFILCTIKFPATTFLAKKNIIDKFCENIISF